MTKVPPIGGYYGGKATLAKHILPHIPFPPSTLASPFAGFASVEISSPQKALTLADASPATVSLLRSIRDRPNQLIGRLNRMNWGIDAFHECRDALSLGQGSLMPLSLAAMAYSAMAHHRGGSMSWYSSQQCARAKTRDWSYLLKVSKALQWAEIFCADFQETIPCFRGAALYLDPPYLEGGVHYHHTMSIADHRRMLELAQSHNAPVIISGYPSELYDTALAGWRRVTFPAKNSHRKAREEVLWIKD